MTSRTLRQRLIGWGPLRLALCVPGCAALGLGACQGRSEAVLTGTFSQVQGSGRMEFSKDRVYVTTLLGMTCVGAYEVDGNRVIIKGIGGQQVFTLDGDTLDGGAGLKFVRGGEAGQQAVAPTGAAAVP